MLIILVAFWVVLAWGLYEAIIQWREAGAWALVWLTMALFLGKPQFQISACFGLTIEACLMVLRVFGKDIVIR